MPVQPDIEKIKHKVNWSPDSLAVGTGPWWVAGIKYL